MSTTDSLSLSAQALSAWEAIAGHWDATITKTGNKYWRRLQEPCLGRLLAAHLGRPGCRALDLATGNGLCARWMASKMRENSGDGDGGSCYVLATDGSEEMLRIARGYAQADGELESEAGSGRMEFRVVDVTSERDLQALVEGTASSKESKFDVVLINMAIMDVATLEPLARALPGLLAEDGVFVATLLHPVFFTSGASRNVDLRYNPVTGELEVERTMVIRDYMSVPPAKGIAVPGQPVKQVRVSREPTEAVQAVESDEGKIYFHRPMHELFATFFRAGLVMDAMEELAFGEGDGEARIEATSNYTQVPVILAFRMRLP